MHSWHRRTFPRLRIGDLQVAVCGLETLTGHDLPFKLIESNVQPIKRDCVIVQFGRKLIMNTRHFYKTWELLKLAHKTHSLIKNTGLQHRLVFSVMMHQPFPLKSLKHSTNSTKVIQERVVGGCQQSHCCQWKTLTWKASAPVHGEVYCYQFVSVQYKATALNKSKGVHLVSVKLKYL